MGTWNYDDAVLPCGCVFERKQHYTESKCSIKAGKPFITRMTTYCSYEHREKAIKADITAPPLKSLDESPHTDDSWI